MKTETCLPAGRKCDMSFDAKKILKVVSLSIFLLSIVSYAFLQSKDLIFGVKIIDVNITDGGKMENDILNIIGNAKNALKLTLNDRIISIDQEGNFSETIVLNKGYNIISVKAEDEFGNVDVANYKLMY